MFTLSSNISWNWPNRLSDSVGLPGFFSLFSCGICCGGGTPWNKDACSTLPLLCAECLPSLRCDVAFGKKEPFLTATEPDDVWSQVVKRKEYWCQHFDP